MPADITGTEIIQEDPVTGEREFEFLPGPIFANMVLADEINRTPPKTQAALLEAMQEHQVTAGGQTLPAGRAVLRAGDAEPDRAGRHLSAARGAARPLHVHGAASTTQPMDEELAIMKRTTTRSSPKLPSTASRPEDILQLQEIVRACRCADHVYRLRCPAGARDPAEHAGRRRIS